MKLAIKPVWKDKPPLIVKGGFPDLNSLGYTPFKLKKPLRRFKLRRGVPKKARVKLKKLGRRVLNQQNFDPSKQLSVKDICVRVVTLAQILVNKTYYPYQVSLGFRIVESLLMHDGDVITSLMSRQSGKTETIGGIVAACAIILPVLAKQYPDDWRLNITDDQGNYRGFSTGLKVGIYAPRQDQAGITFDRVRSAFESKNSEKVLKELGISQSVNNGNTVELTNDSEVKCESASEQSKIEGATHHLLIAEEAQDISDLKMRKSLHPMTASTMGTIVKIGTASTQKCDFYNAIQENRRMELLTGQRNHFFFPWTVCARYNSLYRSYIEKEKSRIGEDSDEFRMSYLGQWIFERGMFVTQETLFNPEVASVYDLWSEYHTSNNFQGVLKHMPIVAGIDWGQSSDSTVVCLMAVDWLNPMESGETYDSSGAHRYTYYKKHVIGWIEFLGDNYEYQFGEIVERLSTIPNLRKIVMDSNTCGKPLYDRAAAVFAASDVEVEPFNFQAKLKSSGYQLLSADLWSARTTFPAGKSVRSGIHYRKFVTQMLDLKKEYKNNIMHVSHPDERGAHDDYCFPAGSPVVTRFGTVGIDKVRVGDEVLTRKGWKKVLNSFQSGVKKLIRVGNIVGTPNHPVYCVNSGMYVRLDELMLDDIVLECCSKQEMSLSSTEFALPDTQSQKGGTFESTIGRTQKTNPLLSRSMFTCGKENTGTFLKDLLSTIKTVTQGIIQKTVQTFVSRHEQNISDPTLPSPAELGKQRRISSWLKKLLWRPVGTEAKSEDEKQESVPIACGLKETLPVKSAQSVTQNTIHEQPDSHSLVPRRVRDVGGDAHTLRLFGNTQSKEVPVYNLTVEDENEYFCQGILVHNCDAFMLANWGAATPVYGRGLETQSSNPFLG